MYEISETKEIQLSIVNNEVVILEWNKYFIEFEHINVFEDDDELYKTKNEINIIEELIEVDGVEKWIKVTDIEVIKKIKEYVEYNY